MCSYCPANSEEHTLWERSTHKGGTSRMHENECWRENMSDTSKNQLGFGRSNPLKSSPLSHSLASLYESRAARF